VVFGMQDIPEDPTGELDKVQKFVLDNLDICKWVSLGVVLLEVSADLARPCGIMVFLSSYN
jgi:hypothetical protein